MKYDLAAFVNYCKIRFFFQNNLIRKISGDKKFLKHQYITIAISTNEHFIKQTQIMIMSLENIGCFVKLYILNINLSDALIQSLNKVAPENVEILVVSVDACSLSNLKISKKWPIEAWVRVLIPKLVPEKKVLYLDVDTIVVDELTSIFNLSSNPITGVLCTYYFRQGMHEYLPHGVNSGVLILDTEELLHLNFPEKVLEYAKNNVELLQMPDQDSINVVSRDYMKNIPPRYNVMNFFFALTHKKICKYIGNEFYSESQYKEALFNPAILHFNGGPFARPWLKKGIKHPYYKVYRYYEEKVNLVNRKT
ncbi:hypothetical protein HCC70_04070 [Streptococcus suis]|uniref:Glycosyltransferase n=1 Tax=Streptococcus suivaginalis TaxID=3028082 RepID=A0AA96VMT9_9STRE|nr:glycosyltransferase [Streptococcus sp. 29896]MCK4027516.1 hypothetical protein [Streptococcus suis]WNY47894.1 glycosyltransferase [Streptococcus sp. 29896]